MKKVLVIANLFHASPRIPGLVKYLRTMDWEPVIVTPRVSGMDTYRFGSPGSEFIKNNRVLETDPDLPFAWLKRIAGTESASPSFERDAIKSKYPLFSRGIGYRIGKWGYTHIIEEFLYYPDPEKGWLSPAINAVQEFLLSEHADAMISSSSPIISHIIAKKIKMEFGIPWVADFRDLWSDNHNYPYGTLRKLLDRHLEEKTLRMADSITTVSPVWAEKLHQKYPEKPVTCITNGYDPETISPDNVPHNKKFLITYTGQIYASRQNPKILLKAIYELISEGFLHEDSLECRFFGPPDTVVSELMKKMHLDTWITQYGTVDRQTSIRKQGESDVLLLLNWEDSREKGVYPLKIFEYLAARRPILATGGYGGDVVEALLNETGAGVNARNISETKEAIKKFYSEFVALGTVRYSGDPAKTAEYSYLKMAENFSKVLNHITLDSSPNGFSRVD